MIESEYGDLTGRVAHRFSEFLLLHEKVSKKTFEIIFTVLPNINNKITIQLAKKYKDLSLPSPPGKKPFSKHTPGWSSCQIQIIFDFHYSIFTIFYRFH